MAPRVKDNRLLKLKFMIIFRSDKHFLHLKAHLMKQKISSNITFIENVDNSNCKIIYNTQTSKKKNGNETNLLISVTSCV